MLTDYADYGCAKPGLTEKTVLNEYKEDNWIIGMKKKAHLFLPTYLQKIKVLLFLFCCCCCSAIFSSDVQLFGIFGNFVKHFGVLFP